MKFFCATKNQKKLNSAKCVKMSLQTSLKHSIISFTKLPFYILRSLFFVFLIFESILIVQQTLRKLSYFNFIYQNNRVGCTLCLSYLLLFIFMISLLGNNIFS